MSFLPTDRVMLRALRASKIRGVQLAIVVDNKDGEGNPGYRVKVKFPWLTEQETSFWARIAVPMGGSGRGTYVLPEIDDQVLVVFEHGDINRPIYASFLCAVGNNASALDLASAAGIPVFRDIEFPAFARSQNYERRHNSFLRRALNLGIAPWNMLEQSETFKTGAGSP
jgi:hypothetical protein